MRLLPRASISRAIDGFNSYDWGVDIDVTDDRFEPFPVSFRDPSTGAERTVTIVGVWASRLTDKYISGIYVSAAAYEEALRKRKVWMEPLFGEAKVLHGLRRFRLRGLHKANMEGLMVAAGQNLKRLLKHGSAPRWPAPSALTGLLRFLAGGPILRPRPAY